jgi:hypothetical protein
MIRMSSFCFFKSTLLFAEIVSLFQKKGHKIKDDTNLIVLQGSQPLK